MSRPARVSRNCRALGLAGALLVALIAACGAPIVPTVSPETQVWSGPTTMVSSHGVTTYERREIAQTVPLPLCISIGTSEFKFDKVTQLAGSAAVPPGSFDTGYSLDRWRLLAPAGELAQQPTVYVSVLGSTGVIAHYQRLPEGSHCTSG